MHNILSHMGLESEKNESILKIKWVGKIKNVQKNLVSYYDSMSNEKFFDYIRVIFCFDFFAATTCLPLYIPFSSAKWESPFPAALSATLFQSFRAVSLIQLVVRCLLRCFEVFFFGANDIAKSLYDKNKKICYVRDYIESIEECKFFIDK